MKTRYRDTDRELRVRLRRTLICPLTEYTTEFFHEDTTKENQFITATYFKERNVLDVGIFLDKVPTDVLEAIIEQRKVEA